MANTLEIVIKATDKASKEIGSVAKGISGLGDIGGAVLKGVGVAAGAAVAAVGAVGAALGKLAVDALPLQGIEGAFGGITGDAEAMLAALQEGSQGMITNKNLMMSYNQAAQLVGKQFADQLPDAMNYLTKVASATGQDMGFMMDSLVKGVGRLSPMILDNLGIQVSLEEATARAAEMFGVEADALTKAQQQAGMMDVVLEKLKTNTASMPEVAGTAAQQWANLGVQFTNLKDRIGLALVPALGRIMDILGDGPAMEWVYSMVDLFEQQVGPAVLKAADAIVKFFQETRKYGTLEAFKNLLWRLVPPQLAAQVTEIADKLAEFSATIAEFVSKYGPELKGALAGIGVALAGIMVYQKVTAFVAALKSIGTAITLLSNPIGWIIAAGALLGAAWAGNWGGIQEKTKAVWAALQPIFETIREWLAENIPAAIAAASAFWTDTLQPAIESVWGFIQQDLIPLFEAVWALLEVAGGLAITALTGYWENVLQPGLEVVWAFIQDKVIPIFEEIWGFITGTFMPALGELAGEMEGPLSDAFQWLKDKVLDPVRGAFDHISEAVQGVIGWIGGLTEKLRNIQLPAWLTPGSPTPFEMGLRGISKALKDISTAQLPEFNAQLNVNRTGPVGAGAAASQAPTRGGNEYHLHIHTSAPTENIMADFAVLQALAG